MDTTMQGSCAVNLSGHAHAHCALRNSKHTHYVLHIVSMCTMDCIALVSTCNIAQEVYTVT